MTSTPNNPEIPPFPGSIPAGGEPAALRGARPVFARPEIIFPTLLLLGVDHGTKFLASVHAEPGTIIPFFWGFGCTFAINRGFTFNIGESWGAWALLLSALAKGLVVVFAIFSYRYYAARFRDSRLIRLALIFLLAAGLGNLGDQLLLGYVRDFLVWPGPGIANLADVFAKFSIICLFLELLAAPYIGWRDFWRMPSKTQFRTELLWLSAFAKTEARNFCVCVCHPITSFAPLIPRRASAIICLIVVFVACLIVVRWAKR